MGAPFSPLETSFHLLLGRGPVTTLLPQTAEELLDVGIAATALHERGWRSFGDGNENTGAEVLQLFQQIKENRLLEAQATVLQIQRRFGKIDFSQIIPLERWAARDFGGSAPTDKKKKIQLAEKMTKYLELGLPPSSDGKGLLMTVGSPEAAQRVFTIDDVFNNPRFAENVAQVLSGLVGKKKEKLEVEFSGHLYLDIETRPYYHSPEYHLNILIRPLLAFDAPFFKPQQGASLLTFLDASLPSLLPENTIDLEGEKQEIRSCQTKGSSAYQLLYQISDGSFLRLDWDYSRTANELWIHLPNGKKEDYNKWLVAFLSAHKTAIGFAP